MWAPDWAHKLAQKNEEIQHYKAERTVVLNQIQGLVRNESKIVNKAHLYDKLMETSETSSTWQTLQIMVKYSRSMKNLLNEIQKHLLPQGTRLGTSNLRKEDHPYPL